MKINLKTILFTFVFIIASNQLFSQNLVNKLSKQLCECLEKEKIKNINEMNGCFEDIIIDNLKEIKQFYNARTFEEINIEELAGKVGVKMMNECNYVRDNFPSGGLEGDKRVEKQPDLKCDDIRKGDFYYVKTAPNQVQDTTYVTITDKMYLERMKKGQTYSLLDINWTSDCKFTLTFSESNDPFKKEMSKKGDIYQYEVVQNNANSMFLQINWKGKDYQFEMFKMK